MSGGPEGSTPISSPNNHQLKVINSHPAVELAILLAYRFSGRCSTRSCSVNNRVCKKSKQYKGHSGTSSDEENQSVASERNNYPEGG